MKNREASRMPVVTGNSTIYDGEYQLLYEPSALAPHNEGSWRIIYAIMLAYGSARFWDLCAAVRGHRHMDREKTGLGPQSFVRYCIRSGWLKRKAP